MLLLQIICKSKVQQCELILNSSWIILTTLAIIRKVISNDFSFPSVTVKYYGKASHSAAYPWEGLNALDAAVLAYNNLSVFRQQMKPTWRVHGMNVKYLL